MAAAPNKECESVSFVSALSLGITYAEPLASVYPSQLKKDTPQSDITKQTFVPVRVQLRLRGRGRGRVCVCVLVSRHACSLCYVYIRYIRDREKKWTVAKIALVRGSCASFPVW